MSISDPSLDCFLRPPLETASGKVPLIANRFSYFFRRRNNLHYWNITTQPLRTLRPLDVEALRCAADHLVDHHAGLRLQLHQQGSNWHQEIIEPHLTRPLISLTSTHSHTDDSFIEFATTQIKLVCNGFSLPGDLFRILAIQAGDGPAILFIAAHHLVVDGYSFNIVLRDLFDLYRRYCRRELASLPPKTTSLAEYSNASTTYWLGQADEDLHYWESLPWSRVQPIPTDYPERADSLCEKCTAFVVKSMPIYDLLVALARNEPDSFTFVDVLLAAIGRAYYQWTGHPVLPLAMVFNGRESFSRGIDLSRTVGWLSETVPILIQPTLPLNGLLDDIHKQVQRAGLRGKSYGVLRFLNPDVSQSQRLRQLPYPSVSLNVKVPRFVNRSFEDIAAPCSNYDVGPENMDDTQRVFHISGGALFRDRQFYLSWDFSTALFDIENVESFANECVRELISMACHNSTPMIRSHLR